MPEREIKLSPPPGFRLPALDGIGAGPDGGDLVAPNGPARCCRPTYYDTADLRLARAGALACATATTTAGR